MASADHDKDGETSTKPKRVRTGCLTCRERHLKCDEALPLCNNCKKSNRACKRGVRLNFLDTWTARPPQLVTSFGTPDWRVTFLDESREIASEYQGGTEKYGLSVSVEKPQPTYSRSAESLNSGRPDTALGTANSSLTLPEVLHQPSSSSSYPVNTFELPLQPDSNHARTVHSHSHFLPQSGTLMPQSNMAESSASVPHGSTASFGSFDSDLQDLDPERKEFLTSPDETLYMQVFVEEVGLWMDSMDPQKHFSRLLPFHALSEPMLLNAFLACGARHLTLVNSVYAEEKALHYYDTATRHLLHNLQNPYRDTVICATTAVILNVYEIMSERALQRMNHIAGARALIKECGWNARSSGIGAACFWLNVGLEVLSCLHFNWQVAWNPDDWGLDLNLSREIHNGREEIWTHRMLYIVAKVCNFRATTPRQQEPHLTIDQTRLQTRYDDWIRLKGMCDAWNEGIPRTMHPMAFLYPYQTRNRSCFPEVWLVKRTTTVARLFYHTAMLLLSQTHPLHRVAENVEMGELCARHSQMICGIAAHLKDRGVASVALRSLAHAAEVLTERKEQEEALRIFERINRETGWRIGFVYKELKQKWNWPEDASPQQLAQTHSAAAAAQRQVSDSQHQQSSLHQLQQGLEFAHQHAHGQPPPPLPPPPSQQRPPPGISNPLYAKADFNLPQHPYQSHYVAPMTEFGQAAGAHEFFPSC